MSLADFDTVWFWRNWLLWSLRMQYGADKAGIAYTKLDYNSRVSFVCIFRNWKRRVRHYLPSSSAAGVHYLGPVELYLLPSSSAKQPGPLAAWAFSSIGVCASALRACTRVERGRDWLCAAGGDCWKHAPTLSRALCFSMQFQVHTSSRHSVHLTGRPSCFSNENSLPFSQLIYPRSMLLYSSVFVSHFPNWIVGMYSPRSDQVSSDKRLTPKTELA